MCLSALTCDATSPGDNLTVHSGKSLWRVHSWSLMVLGGLTGGLGGPLAVLHGLVVALAALHDLVLSLKSSGLVR